MKSIQEIPSLLKEVWNALEHLLSLLFVVGVAGRPTVPTKLKPLREFGPEQRLPVGFTHNVIEDEFVYLCRIG